MITIPLTQGQVAFIDDEDETLISQYKWSAIKQGHAWYARAWIGTTAYNREKVQMHTLIMQTPKGKQIDHIDGNGLNNQRHNLRITDARGNARNRHTAFGESKHMGVCLNGNGKWQAAINGHYLGSFDNEEEAAQAYLNARDSELYEESKYDKYAKGAK